MGAQRRFSALTDYLLGAGTDDGAVAPFMVQRATVALQTARDDWEKNADRDYYQQLQTAASAQRAEAIRRRFGEAAWELCGNPTWDSYHVLDMWTEINPDTCYIREDCQLTMEQIQQRLSVADLGHGLCVLHLLRKRFGDRISSGHDLDNAAEFYGPVIAQEDTPFPLEIVDRTGDRVYFKVSGDNDSQSSLPWISVAKLSFNFGDMTDQERLWLQDSLSICNSAKAATLAQRPTPLPLSCQFTDECPVDYVCSLELKCVPDTIMDALQRPECFMGGLGQIAIAIQAAAKEVEIARSEMNELSDAYDIAMTTCIITNAFHGKMEDLLESHNDTMNDLGAAKLAMDIAANFAGAAKDTAATGNPLMTSGTAAAAFAEASFKSISDGLAFAMEKAERSYQEDAMELEHELEDAVCLNDAKMYVVGMKTAVLRVDSALLALAERVVELRDKKIEMGAYLTEGHDALMNELNRRVSPMESDFWLAEDVETYTKYLRQAKRAVYLALLAAEYEFQFTSNQRSEVLGARSPAELQDVIDHLRSVAMTGTVGGASPGNLFTVVSLSNHLLQIADQQAMPDGWKNLSPAERFRLWLTSPVHAVYDAKGVYLGQQIPFNLAPLGTIGIGDAAGIPILAGTDCAERLWSVNASLQGADIEIGGGTFARVVLKKRNTFYSQWCVAQATEPQFQTASTRPSRNLFIDPYDVNGSVTPATPQPDTTSTDEVNGYSNARISAYFNITRAELEDQSYFNGNSQELAGRGLYGDYALFFPAEMLSDKGKDGVVLQNVTDVLLRFDYVSVAAN